MSNVIKESSMSTSLDHRSLQHMEENVGSSFYLLDVSRLRENYQKIYEAFSSRYEQFIIGYSYKTNYTPFLCKELKQLGAYAEVVSRLEYDLALKIGHQPQKIIFNGPLKTKEDIYYALKNESIINLDAAYEVEYIRDYCNLHRSKQIKVGLRVNFDISEQGQSPLVEGLEISRFGFCVENGEFFKVVKQLQMIPNLSVVGLHGHFSTSRRRVHTYRRITQKMCHLAKEYLPGTLEYIDIGGGIYGEVPDSLISDTPTFDDYAEGICQVMKEEFNDDKQPFLILEPGISMVANVFQFIAKVIGRKQIRDQHFILVDGSAHNIKPTFHSKNLPMKIIRKNNNSEDLTKPVSFHIVGYTCLEKDYLACHYLDHLPHQGDYLIFDNVGAYTIVFNPPFIKERPAILAIDHPNIQVIRKKENISQFFSEELYSF